MAVVLRASLRTAIMTAIRDDIDSGAGPGVLQVGTAGMASVLAEFTLTDPCGTVSGDVLTFDFDPDISDTSANATGTAAAARIRNSNGDDVVTGLTVGTSGTDIILGSTSITLGGTVTIATGTLTHPSS